MGEQAEEDQVEFLLGGFMAKHGQHSDVGRAGCCGGQCCLLYQLM